MQRLGRAGTFPVCLILALFLCSAALALTLSPKQQYASVDRPDLEKKEEAAKEPPLLPGVPKSTSVQLFKTEPEIEQLTFEYLRMTSDPTLLAPGYLFFTIQSKYEPVHSAAIYDTSGNLIWFTHRSVQTQDLHTCDYLGERGNHLCLHNWLPRQKEIFNRNYELVWTQSSGLTDSHEFNVLPGGHSFITVGGRRKKLDLTPYAAPSDGYAGDACLMEYDIKTHHELFKWCYLESGLPIWATHLWMKLKGHHSNVNSTMASRKAGEGTEDNPWKFGHPNAGDMVDGDYFISIRHLDQIIKLAGPKNRHGVKAGTVLWRLGGTGSDIEMPPNLNFTRQHHVRVHSMTSDYTVLSIFNNGWEGTNPPSVNTSSGMMIGVNNRTMKAELIQDYPHPDGIIADSRGSLQVLPNKNVLVGYGRAPEVIEHDRNGTILAHLRFTRFKHQDPFNFDKAGFSYRIYKQDWTGFPADQPKAVAYTRTCTISHESPLMLYASWNGATEISSWRFSVGATAKGPWTSAGTFQKTGFETQARLLVQGRAAWVKHVFVEALHANNTVLGQTRVKIFVPKDPEASSCLKDGCHRPVHFDYSAAQGRQCLGLVIFFKLLAGVVLVLEVTSLLYTLAWYTLWDFVIARRDAGVYEPVKDVAKPIVMYDIEAKFNVGDEDEDQGKRGQEKDVEESSFE